jgi:DNA-binding CsgD family transcriptional regulator
LAPTPSAALVDSLPDEALAQRVDAGLYLMAAELQLDRFADARRHGWRALEVGRATGQGFLFPALLPALGACCETLGRLAESIELLDSGVEAARLSGNAQSLALALMNRSMTATAAGDAETAVACAEESVTVAEGANTLATGFAAGALARALVLAGEPARALDLLLVHGGGDELPRVPGVWRVGAYEQLVLCQLGAGQREAAARTVERCRRLAAHTQLRFPLALAERAAAAVALDTGAPALAAEHSLASAAALDAVEAPVHAALARQLAGRALASSGDRGGAIAQLERAAEAFASCGATRRRDAVERELRRLGRTIYRRSGPSGLDTLTARELEIARLVVDRQTNAQIAAALFLSKKTVETHLRNIFGKVGVSSRVELARAVERADRDA